MPLVKILDNGQITLPPQLYIALGLKSGDYVNVELADNRIMLIPHVTRSKAEAKERFFELVAQIQENAKAVPSDELEALISEAVEATKKEHGQVEGRH